MENGIITFNLECVWTPLPKIHVLILNYVHCPKYFSIDRYIDVSQTLPYLTCPYSQQRIALANYWKALGKG